MEEVGCVPPSLDSNADRLLCNYGCELLQKAGILLQLNAVTIATGQNILHHFYLKRSLREFDIRATAATACFLSSKLEDNMRKVKDVARVFDFLVHQEDTVKGPVNHLDQIFAKEILRIELEILVEFGFRVDTILVCPHRYILQYVYALFRNLEEYSCHSVNDVAQRAWAYLNDSMRTNLCCSTRPGVIAAGCIYMAATSLGIPLKKESSWFTVFDACWSDIVLICKELESIYVMGKSHYVNVSGVTYMPSAGRSAVCSTDKNQPDERSDASPAAVRDRVDSDEASKEDTHTVDDDHRNEDERKARHGNHGQRRHHHHHHRSSDERDHSRDRYRSHTHGSRHSDHANRESREWDDLAEYERNGGRGPSPFGRAQDRRRYPEDRRRRHGDHHHDNRYYYHKHDRDSHGSGHRR